MMTLYSGTVDPFSQRCRNVLYEKGMDFQIIDVDMYNKPEDLAVMNPYNQVPVLVERDESIQEQPGARPAVPVSIREGVVFAHRSDRKGHPEGG